MSTGLCLLPRQEHGLALRQVPGQLAFENGRYFLSVCLPLQPSCVARSCRGKYAQSLAKLTPPNHSWVASHPVCTGREGARGRAGICVYGVRGCYVVPSHLACLATLSWV